MRKIFIKVSWDKADNSTELLEDDKLSDPESVTKHRIKKTLHLHLKQNCKTPKNRKEKYHVLNTNIRLSTNLTVSVIFLICWETVGLT